MSALLLKKKYLDDTNNFSKISGSKLEFIVGSVKNMILPEKSLTFLKRCCEILVKVFTHIVTISNNLETRKIIDPNHHSIVIC
jgi:hypothetical protein